MFGYVTPCKMELKIKDYEKFNAYYCGLCSTIKYEYGNLPRMTLNYDMTFLAVFLDSLNDIKCAYKKEKCIIHPLKKRIFVINNNCLKYAAFCNLSLAYYNFIDNIKDDNSLISMAASKFLKLYLKSFKADFKLKFKIIGEKLNNLYSAESSENNTSLDGTAHYFGDLIGFIISSYYDHITIKDDLYLIGYHLGRWIYIIDAFDDLKSDIEKNKFNAINKIYNKNNYPYEKFEPSIKNQINFSLTASANKCLEILKKLPIKKNRDLLFNIFEYGLLEKMDKVFKGVDNK